MARRAFDAVGIIAVAAWLGILGSFAYTRATEATRQAGTLKTIRLTAGETWMFIYGKNPLLIDYIKKNREQIKGIEADIRKLQDDKSEIGYMHESRVRIRDGWLIEYDTYAALALPSGPRVVRVQSKARLDDEAKLQQFTSSVSGSVVEYTARGTVKGNTLHLTITAGDATRTRDIPIKHARLVQTAAQRLIARADVEKGKVYRDEGIDPIALSLHTPALTYHGRKPIEAYGYKDDDAHYLEVQANGDMLDIYMNDRGELIIQELPNRTVMVRQFAAQGRLRARTIRKLIEGLHRSLRDRGKLPKKTPQPNLASHVFQDTFALFGATPLGASGKTGADAPKGEPDDAKRRPGDRRAPAPPSESGDMGASAKNAPTADTPDTKPTNAARTTGEAGRTPGDAAKP